MENRPKIVLGMVKINKKSQNNLPWTTCLLYFAKYMVGCRPPASRKRWAAAFGRRPSFVKIQQKSCPKNDMFAPFAILSIPRTILERFSEGSSGILDFLYFDYLLTILRGPSGIHQNHIFHYFSTILNGFYAL